MSENETPGTYFAAVVIDSNGTPMAYTRFGTSTDWIGEAAKYPSRAAATGAIRTGRRECGHKGYKVRTWEDARELLLTTVCRSGQWMTFKDGA